MISYWISYINVPPLLYDFPYNSPNGDSFSGCGPADRTTAHPTDSLTDRLTDRQTDSSSDRRADSPTDRLTNRPSV